MIDFDELVNEKKEDCQPKDSATRKSMKPSRRESSAIAGCSSGMKARSQTLSISPLHTWERSQ